MANRSGIVRTARGLMLDMNRIAKENPNSIAMTAGGVSMNARGDIIGRGGKIIKTREALEKAYNQANEKAAKQVTTKQVPIKKTHISPDNLPDEQPRRREREKNVNIPETYSLDEISEAFEQSEQKKKRKTSTDE